jgi:LPS export ABC transporter protein LptC
MKQQQLENLNKRYNISLLRISIVVFTMLILSCNKQTEAPKVIQERDSVLLFADVNSEIVYTELGLSKVKINSGLVNYYTIDEGKTTIIENRNGFKVVFYNEDGKSIKSTLSGEIAITKNQEETEIKYNVVVHNSESGETLYTEQLFWDKNKELIWTDKVVKIVTEDGITYGKKGMEANQNFDKGYRIKDPTADYEFDVTALDSTETQE